MSVFAAPLSLPCIFGQIMLFVVILKKKEKEQIAGHSKRLISFNNLLICQLSVSARGSPSPGLVRHFDARQWIMDTIYYIFYGIFGSRLICSSLAIVFIDDGKFSSSWNTPNYGYAHKERMKYPNWMGQIGSLIDSDRFFVCCAGTRCMIMRKLWKIMYTIDFGHFCLTWQSEDRCVEMLDDGQRAKWSKAQALRYFVPMNRISLFHFHYVNEHQCINQVTGVRTDPTVTFRCKPIR